MNQVKIFTGTASKYFAEKVAAAYGTGLGDASLQKFSDGEMAPHFNESVRGAEVFIIQSTFPPADNLLELMLMVDAAKRASALTARGRGGRATSRVHGGQSHRGVFQASLSLFTRSRRRCIARV